MLKKQIALVIFVFLVLSISGMTEEKMTNPVITRHSLNINGRNIAYSAHVGTLALKSANGKPLAEVFFTAYFQEGAAKQNQRPITFAFNGGPGSSSVWLHLGALGPKKVLMDDTGLIQAVPFRLVDNKYSILDITDLVFIDPVSTGYSRAVPGEDPKQFHGYSEDIAAVGEFIRSFITNYERWESPKFVLGESYGTIRASGLAGYLQGRSLGMYLNGVILVSAVLNSLVKDFSAGNDLPYIYFFPGYTAAAWYHKKLPADLLAKKLPEVLQQTEKFATEVLTPALFKGNELPPDEKARVITGIARYTGLASDYIEQSNMRINLYRFLKELLRKERYAVGRLDSRFKGKETDPAGERFGFDPSNAAIYGSFSSLLNHYMRDDLQYKTVTPYAISGNVRPWSYGQVQPRTVYSNSVEVLRQALSINKDLRIFVANGYYDFATPYFATKYAIAHLGLNNEYKDRIFMRYYEAGHMMYIHKPSHAKLKKDLEEFYRLTANIQK